MHLYKEYTVSAAVGVTAVSPVFVPNQWSAPFNMGIGCVVQTSAVYTVQHTFANPFQYDLNVSAAQVTWFDHEYLVAKSTNEDGNYAYPVTGIRLAVNPSSDGSVRIRLVQSGGC